MLVYRATCFAYGELENLRLGYMTPQQRRMDEDHELYSSIMNLYKVNSFGQYQFNQTKYFYLFIEDAYAIFSPSNKSLLSNLDCKKFEIFEYDIPVELLSSYIGMGTYRSSLNHPVLEFAIPYDVLREYYEPGFKKYNNEDIDIRNQKMLIDGVKGSLDPNRYDYINNIYKINCLTGNVFSPVGEILSSSRKSGYERYVLGEYKKFLELLNIKYNINGKTSFPGFLKEPVFNVSDDNKYNIYEVEKLLNDMVDDYALTKTMR